MRRKSTDDLKQELMERASLDQYITENEAYFVETDLTEVLARLYERCGLSKAELARQAEMSEVYLRDRLLCLCIGMDSTLEDVDLLLKGMGYAPIYPRLKRDAIISHGLLHHTPLAEINDKLFSENEKTLF